MFTNNMIKLQELMFFGTGDDNTKSGFVNAAGTSFTAANCYAAVYGVGARLATAKCGIIVPHSADIYFLSYPDSVVSSGVYFGTGTTVATKADYTLENPITSGLAITNPSSFTRQNDGNGQYILACDYIIRNDTDAKIAISEIGLFVAVATNTSRPTASNKHVVGHSILVERTVLDEPIVITAGASKLVTYKITFNQGENV